MQKLKQVAPKQVAPTAAQAEPTPGPKRKLSPAAAARVRAKVNAAMPKGC